MLREHLRCASCGSPGPRSLGPVPNNKMFLGAYVGHEIPQGQLYRCPACHILFKYPVLPEARREVLYNAGPVGDSSEIWTEGTGRRVDWETAAEWLSEALSGRGRVLDVGCNTGGFFGVLGGKYEKAGIETNPAAIEVLTASGIEVVGRTLWDLEGEGGGPEYDAITLFDVIEHFESPERIVMVASRKLKPGGCLVVSSGNSACLTWRLMGSAYYYGCYAEHLSFINADWCRYMEGRAGLDLERLHNYTCHGGGLRARYLSEACMNLLYRLSPSLFAALRRAGLGGLDTRQYPSLALSPPTWSTARNHMIVMFRRPSSE